MRSSLFFFSFGVCCRETFQKVSQFQTWRGKKLFNPRKSGIYQCSELIICAFFFNFITYMQRMKIIFCMLNSTFPWIQKFFTPFMFRIVILFETFHDDTHGMKKKTNSNASKRISNVCNDHQFYMLKKATFCMWGNICWAITSLQPKNGSCN